MTRDERARWCIQQAEEIEAGLPPQDDPHMWTWDRISAQFWRDMAGKVAAGGPDA